MNVGQAKIAALKTVGQPQVVQTKQPQDGGLQIVGVDGFVWYHLTDDSGWLRSDTVTTSGDCENLPEVEL